MPAAQYQKRERAAIEAGFLKALSRGLTVKDAAREAGVERTLLYQWRRGDETFANRWHLARQLACDVPADPLEAEAERRAMAGVEKPVYRGGTLVGHTRDYSDAMLIFLLKAKFPEKYDRKTTEDDKGREKLETRIANARETLEGKLLQKPEPETESETACPAE